MDQQQLSTEGLQRHDGLFDDSYGGRRNKAVLAAFCFGPFRLIPHARLLERDGSPTALSSRAFDLLCLLVGRAGKVVSKSDLMAEAWPNVNIEESSLRFHIAKLRRALGDGEGGDRYLVNIPGRGYCFVACVDEAA
jgi:DNA-binding winged helix-turn-helix (wHTH) protein